MAISIVGGSTGTNTTTINKPTGTASGNLMVMFIASDAASAAPTPPTGWTTLDTLQINQNTHVIWCTSARLVAGASEPASYTWTAGTGSGFNAGCIVTVSGQDATTPIDDHGTGQGSTSVSVSALTASVAGDMLIVFSEDFQDFGVSTWPESGSILSSASALATGDFQTGTASSLASGSTGTLTTSYNSGSNGALGNLDVLVKAAGGGGATAWNQSVSDSHSALDVTVKGPQKNLPGEAFSQRDSRTNTPGKNLFDTHSALDILLPKAVTKNLIDAHSALDVLAKMPAKTFVERFSELDSVTTQHFSGVLWSRLVTDSHSALDVVQKLAGKLNADAWSAIDAVSRTWVAHLLIQEYVTLTETVLKAYTHTTADGFSETDARALQTAKNLVDAFSPQDVLNRAMSKVQLDTTSGFDTTLKQVQHSVIDSLSQTDRVSVARGVLLKVLDALSLTDQVVRLQDLRPGIRFPLVVAASLVASAFNINVSLTSTPNLTVAP